MTILKRLNIPSLLLVLTIVAGGVSLALLLLQLRQELDHQRRIFREDLVWVASQVEREARVFRHTAVLYMEGMQPVPLSDVHQRFDVLWSRIESMDKGELGKVYLQIEGAVEALSYGRTMLATLDPIIADLRPHDTEQRNIILKSVDEAIRKFYSVSRGASSDSLKQQEQRRQRFEGTSQRAMAMVILIFTSGGILVLLVTQKQRALNLLTLSLEDKVRDRTRDLVKSNESLQMLSVAIEQSPVSIIICKIDGNIGYVNQHFEKTSGYKATEVLGLNHKTLQSGQTPARVYQEMWETVQKGQDWSGQICSQQKNGKLYWEQMSLTPILDSQGNIIRCLAFKEDITERKQREKLVAEAQEKENQSKKMAAIGLLASGVAHDLNNILSGVISYPEVLLLNSDLDEKVRNALVAIKKSGEQAAGIVADLLTMARGATIVKEALDFNEVINEFSNSTELSGLRATHPEVIFEFELEKELSLVNASRVHILKIILNLITNAAESFSDEIKTKKVTVKCAEHRLTTLLENEHAIIPAGEYVVLTVQDNGQGISHVDKDRIFEPFYTKKKMGKSGSGLGLSVVWNVVQEHDGYIELQSEYGRTQFILYFPLTDKIAHQKANQTSLEQLYGNEEKVLVVDDVELQREIAGTLLRELRYDCTAVESGEKAIEYLRNHTADLVLLDMIMEPGMNGLETFRRILKINPLQNTIIVSGYSESKDVVTTQELGAAMCLGKPYTIEALGKAIKSVLG